jgi:DNA repair protein RecO (recombination protein O)
LRRFPFGESSLVIHGITPGLGRVSLLAKGAYRTSSAFFAVFDLFDTLEVRWSSRSGEELGTVASAQLVARRPAIPADLARFRAALSFLELAQLAARESHEERGLFSWLEGALELLQRGLCPPGLAQLASDLSFLRAGGLAPSFAACASCGIQPGDRGGAFSVARGGRLCPACARDARDRGVNVETQPLNLLRIADSLMQATPSVVERMRIEDRIVDRLREIVRRFLEYHLEAGLRSRGRAEPR